MKINCRSGRPWRETKKLWQMFMWGLFACFSWHRGGGGINNTILISKIVRLPPSSCCAGHHHRWAMVEFDSDCPIVSSSDYMGERPHLIHKPNQIQNQTRTLGKQDTEKMQSTWSMVRLCWYSSDGVSLDGPTNVAIWISVVMGSPLHLIHESKLWYIQFCDSNEKQARWSRLFWLVIAMMVTMITSEQEAHIFNLGQSSIHKIKQNGPDCFGWWLRQCTFSRGAVQWAVHEP